MAVVSRVLISLCALLLALPLAAAEYEVAPAPAWVLPSEPGAASDAHLRQASDGVSYLLVDNQVMATGTSRVRYYRYVSRALNAKGVESVANLSIDFDPDWQKVQLHSVAVVRDGRVLDKLSGARIEVIQQEKELDELILNGSRTVKLFLQDVRPGDVVDYAFSTIGRNPVFENREFGATDLQWGVPVARLRARLLVPATSALELRTRNSSARPLVSEHDGMRDYRWEFENTKALTVEEGAPDWYAPFAEAEWSEFRDWGAVVRWAQPLYQLPPALGPALEAEARRIEVAEASPAGRMLAALRVVQREVRYLGVETGRNTHAPNAPDLVFARRFGDCKDKVLLTMALLQRLGVEAHPALVNTTMRRGIASRLPNPAAFDHVIVQARIGARHWWLDPTRPTQEADADHLYQPDYGFSLVVAPQAHGLVPMRNAGSLSRRQVHVVMDARKQFSAPVGFRVVTTYEGGAAESQRDELSGSNLESVQQDYLGYYADSYPGIRLAAPMRVADDKKLNRLTTTESYYIANIAGDPDRQGKRRVWIETPDVDELLSDPEVKLRKSPLLLKYPLEVSAVTEVLLPASWPISDSDARVDDPAFSFRRSVRADPGHKRLVIHDEYRSLADEVAAREMPRYTANLAKARGELGYSLDWTDALPPPVAMAGVAVAGFADRINWSMAFMTLFALLLFAHLALRAWRYDPAPRGPADAAFAGIGGWLWLYTLGVLMMPVRLAMQLWENSPAYGSVAWSARTLFGGAHYHALNAPMLLFEWLGLLGLMVASLLLACLYFARRSSYPRLAVAFYALAFAFQCFDLLLAARLPGLQVETAHWQSLASVGLGALAWSAYLLGSRRVRATFVRRWRAPLPAVPEAAGAMMGAASA
jgi:transglutaminase-like putative cysteine protease